MCIHGRRGAGLSALPLYGLSATETVFVSVLIIGRTLTSRSDVDISTSFTSPDHYLTRCSDTEAIFQTDSATGGTPS